MMLLEELGVRGCNLGPSHRSMKRGQTQKSCHQEAHGSSAGHVLPHSSLGMSLTGSAASAQSALPFLPAVWKEPPNLPFCLQPPSLQPKFWSRALGITTLALHKATSGPQRPWDPGHTTCLTLWLTPTHPSLRPPYQPYLGTRHQPHGSALESKPSPCLCSLCSSLESPPSNSSFWSKPPLLRSPSCSPSPKLSLILKFSLSKTLCMQLQWICLFFSDDFDHPLVDYEQLEGKA